MKILVVDDHVLIRQAMHGMLKRLKRDALVLEASSCAQATQTIADNLDLELILLDLTLPDRDGFSFLEELRTRHATIAVVVLSAVQDAANVMRALDLGALGYIPKSAQSDVIVNALRLVMSGGVYIPPEIFSREAAVAAGPADWRHSSVAHEWRQTSHGSVEYMGLTDRQLDVLSLMMQGKSNKTICRMLNLAEPTVKNHVTAILKALNVSNRTEAVVAANSLGWKLRSAAK